jgi:hypothetical protein
MRSLENTLALWVSGLLSSEDVVAWAGKEIIRLEQPPMELFDLVSDGPEKCLKRAEFDFPPRPTRLNYLQAFSVRAVSLNLASPEREKRFLRVKEIYLREVAAFPNVFEVVKSQSDANVLMNALAHRTGFLATFEADSKALRRMIHAMDRSLNPDLPEFEL